MRRTFAVLLLTGIVLAQAAPLGAHHSLSAEFNMEKPVTFRGVVTRVEWSNPHAWMFVNVPAGETGKSANWAFQLPGANMFARRGWTREPFKAGITVTVRGYLAKDGSRKGMVDLATAADGQKLFSTLAYLQPGIELH